MQRNRHEEQDSSGVFIWPPLVLMTAFRSFPHVGITVVASPSLLLLMIEILHDFKDPKLWDLWYIPYYRQYRVYIINRSFFAGAV